MSKLNEIASSSAEYIVSIFEKPKDIKEYYIVGKVMVSKKLVKFLFLVLSVISAIYLLVVLPDKISLMFQNRGSNKTYTKYYTSRSLKNYNGVGKVLTKKSQAEYNGDISQGVASGKGSLYGSNGKLVYEGDFLNNEYSGEGNLYYLNGNICYSGSFQNNKYNGVGKAYYDDGILNYEGEFVDNLKSGEGTLYNKMGLNIFKGKFFKDRPVVEEFLGQNISSLKDIIGGDSIIYNYKDNICVIYKELNVMIVSKSSDKSIKNGGIIQKIYFLDNEQFLKEPALTKKDLDEKFESIEAIKEYTGYSRVLFTEMSAIDFLRKQGKNQFESLSNYDFESKYTEVVDVKNYRSDDKLYMQLYKCNDLEYTFYFDDKDGNYIFYSIERLS